MHALARDSRPFAAFGAKGDRRFGAALVEDVKPALHPRFADVLRIELLRTGKKDVAIGKVKRARVAMVRIMPRQVANPLGGEIDFHRVTEGF